MPVGDLPVTATGLPTVLTGRSAASSVGLPAVVAGLPIVSASLPAVASALPVTAQVLPSPAFGRNFGELDLPMVTESLPTVTESLPRVAESLPKVADVLPTPMPLDRQLPTIAAFDAPLGAFGEIDLPREGPEPTQAAPTRTKASDSSDFGDLEQPEPAGRSDSSDFGDLHLEEERATDNRGGAGAPPVPRRASAGQSSGSTSYGEVELDETNDDVSHAAPRTSLRAEASPEPSPFTNPSRPETTGPSAAEMAMPLAQAPAKRERVEAAREKPSKVKIAALGLAVVAILGGCALQLTPYGAFGYLYATDFIRAGEYAQAAASAMRDSQAALGTDTYDAATQAIDATFASHVRTPRARSLAAYAAIVDFEATIRFGSDPSRESRATQLLATLPADAPPKYLDVALAAQAGQSGSFDKALAGLDAAAKRYPVDSIQADIAFMSGDLALVTGDGASARDAFQRALDMTKSARAHYGLARAYDLLGDAVSTKKEIDATLALTPLHPGALTLRARRESAVVDPAQAAPDIALVLEGPARAKASPSELSTAYAARAWVTLERGGTVDARAAFAQAVKLDPSNVAALNGEGRLFMADGRYAEALARFDTALARAPNSPQTIANDADAKVALERLADAKQQLVAARERFPKDIAILLALANVETHLSNNDAAEAYLRATIANVDPMRPDAVLPYVALS